MLLVILVLSIAFTFAAILAEANPPKQKPTKVVVEMQEDNQWDEDPPTVVALPRPKKPVEPTVEDRYAYARFLVLEWWSRWSPHIENALGAISIVAIMWLGWLWAYLMEG